MDGSKICFQGHRQKHDELHNFCHTNACFIIPMQQLTLLKIYETYGVCIALVMSGIIGVH